MRRAALHLSTSSRTVQDYDVLVVGGGVMGASVAYHTALYDPSLRVCVVERDTSYAHASAMLSAGGIRQCVAAGRTQDLSSLPQLSEAHSPPVRRRQFSLPVNIQLSLYGVDFLRRLAVDLRVPKAPPPDAQFKEQGYLFLASAQGEATLRRNQATQAAQGVSWTRLLSPEALERRFPWLNVEGVALGCVGERCEGWFDPWALLSALRAKAARMGVTAPSKCPSSQCSSSPAVPSQGVPGGSGQLDTPRVRPQPLGAQPPPQVLELAASKDADFTCFDTVGVTFVSANVESIEVERVGGDGTMGGTRVRAAVVRGADGLQHSLGAATLVNAAGAFAAPVVRFCGDSDVVAPLPVAARKRCVFGVHCDAAATQGALPPPGETGLVVDPSGVWFRPEGAPGHFLCGVSPSAHRGDPDCAGVAELEAVDHAIFDEVIWPALYARCEALGSLKVSRGVVKW